MINIPVLQQLMREFISLFPEKYNYIQFIKTIHSRVLHTWIINDQHTRSDGSNYRTYSVLQ